MGVALETGQVKPWFYCIPCHKHGQYVSPGNALIGAQKHADRTGHTVFMGNLMIIEPNPDLFSKSA